MIRLSSPWEIKLPPTTSNKEAATVFRMAEEEFDVTKFEKALSSLKDSQDSINTMSNWCLQRRNHHKKIVGSWLTVLKQGKDYDSV